MTFLFDALFDSSKNINKKKFNELLRKIPEISKQERDYLNETFKKDLSDGLTGYEIKKRVEKLRYNSEDCLDRSEVKKVRKKLLGEFNN